MKTVVLIIAPLWLIGTWIATSAPIRRWRSRRRITRQFGSLEESWRTRG